MAIACIALDCKCRIVPVFEHTCAYAQWANMHRFLSVHLSVCDWTKIHIGQREKNMYVRGGCQKIFFPGLHQYCDVLFQLKRLKHFEGRV